MRRIGAVPLIGDFDFELNLEEDRRLFDKLEEIHHALRGANVRYSITTRTDAEAASMAQNRYEVTHYVGEKPVELKKAVYKAKLERWKEMGLDVSELEAILDQDLDKFKAASKEFLRTHLDEISVVKDRRSEDNILDGKILALLDENGKTLPDLMKRTGQDEEVVMLSLGRLISSESAKRVAKDSTEFYCLVPPPAPVVRKTLQLIPAKDEEDAERRLLEVIPDNGISSKEAMRASRLPREQLDKAAIGLKSKGKIRIIVRGKKVLVYRA